MKSEKLKIRNKKFLFVIVVLAMFPFIRLPVLAALSTYQSPSQNTGINLFPKMDTFVDSNYPDTNFGQEEKLSLSFSDSTQIVFLQFGLENLRPLAKDEKAILQYFLEKSTGPLKTLETEVLLPNSQWQEEELTWNNKPSLYQSELFISLEATPGAQMLDLTPLVKKWQDGSLPNNGLAIYCTQDAFNQTISAKESKLHQPILAFQKPLKTVASNNKTNPASAGLKPQQNYQASVQETSKLRIKGVQTAKFFGTSLERFSRNPKNIVPLTVLWVMSVSILLFCLLTAPR